MHVYTLVITPGPRRSAVTRAEDLLARVVPRGFDYWGVGGRFASRLGRIERPEIDAWYAAEAKREAKARRRFEAEYPDLRRGSELYEQLWNIGEIGAADHMQRLKLERQALIDLTRLTSTLPSPLPPSMIPAALVKPDGRWRMCPVSWHEKADDSRWPRWVNTTIDHYRGGHCVVIADCHC